MGKQLILDLGLRPALGREDFLVAPSNAEAVALVDEWPRWPSYGAVLLGPQGSGKSHLATVWQQRSGAKQLAARDIRTEHLQELPAGSALLIEDLDKGPIDETALFHMMNAAKAANGFLLFTTATPVAGLSVTLPDLRSRLAALPVAAIRAPDDQLLRGLLVKHFTDRQIAVDEALVSYLLTRMPRSADMARQVVAAIDQAALEQGAEVTRAFAGKVLAGILGPEAG